MTPLRINLEQETGHGHFDMASRDKLISGKLEDYEFPSEAIAESIKHLPKVG